MCKLVLWRGTLPNTKYVCKVGCIKKSTWESGVAINSNLHVLSIWCTHELMKSSNFLNQSSFSKLSYFHLITLNPQNFILFPNVFTCHSYRADHFAEVVYLTHYDTWPVSCLWWAYCALDSVHRRRHLLHLHPGEHPQPTCDEVTDMYMCLIYSHEEFHSGDHWNGKKSTSRFSSCHDL